MIASGCSNEKKFAATWIKRMRRLIITAGRNEKARSIPPETRELETMTMLTIFWTAYTPFVLVLLSLIGSFTMDKMRRLSAQLSFAPARGRQRFPRNAK